MNLPDYVGRRAADQPKRKGKTMRSGIFALFASVTLLLRTADPISGTWDVTFHVEGYPSTPASMELKLDGHAVTGKIISAHTGPGKVTEGTWKGDTLSFTAVFESHESIALTGTLQDGQLVGEFKTEGFVAKWEAKRR
jgi:hypothetical protein